LQRHDGAADTIMNVPMNDLRENKMKHLCLNCEKADMVRGKQGKVIESKPVAAVVNLFRILDKHQSW
jgi:hypothetical protein